MRRHATWEEFLEEFGKMDGERKLGLIRWGNFLASGRGNGVRHREGAQGRNPGASGDGHAEASVLAEAHDVVDHCDHLLLLTSAGLVRAVNAHFLREHRVRRG